ncbi:MAG: FMN-binding protein [Pseudomonadota bacterium]
MSFREILKMIVVLTIVSGVCGGGLAVVKMATAEQIEYQKIKNIKEPALKAILSGYDNDPVIDRKVLVVGTDKKGKPIETTIFYAKKGGEVIAVAFEAYGGGFEGDIGVMIAIKMPDEVLDGIAATTHSETPSVGGVALNSPNFLGQFKGRPVGENFGLSSEGGVINAYSGATISSAGASKAIKSGMEIYKKFKSEILG